ncbi:MAG: HRDC domain-containing protein [Acidimicrobiales bacterium]|jgi:ribonuclease D|nr:HRDC domain-containing protein [Acidimicrobiales bacterium]
MVDTERGLAEVVAALVDQPEYALDTEFHRERTYFPKLALMQLAWPGEIVLLDPLAVDVAALAQVLEGPGTAVLHAADQDLEVLQLACGAAPSRLFDTQLAAGFVGMSTPSLSSLYERIVDVRVGKGDRLTDWLQRPLTDAQLAYAANDVAYLLEVEHRLLDDLDRRGRRQWALDECERLLMRSRGQRDPEEAWRRIKEARQLKGRSRAVARAVAAWRERRAAELDIPVRYVLSDMAVVGIAQRPPSSRKELERIRGLDRGFRADAVESLLAAVRDSQDRPLPEVAEGGNGPLDRDLRPAVALVSAWVAQLARDLEIDTTLLATRSDLEALLRGDDDARLAEGWRGAIVGEPIRRLVEGSAAVAFAGGGDLVIEERSNRPLD